MHRFMYTAEALCLHYLLGSEHVLVVYQSKTWYNSPRFSHKIYQTSHDNGGMTSGWIKIENSLEDRRIW